jgi:pyrroline-5-carboxylate reductase
MILGVIGCGKMAKAIVSGIYDKEPRPYATLLVNDIDDGQAKLFVDLFQAQRGDQLEVVGQSDIVLLAVKPHQIGEVLRNTAQAWKPGQLLISAKNPVHQQEEVNGEKGSSQVR